MNLTLLISFIGTVFIIAVTPGPSVLLASANSMNYGTKKTVGTILGDLSANAIQILLSSLGLASIVISSGEIFWPYKMDWCWIFDIYGGDKNYFKPNVEQFKKRIEKRVF